jgi:MoxR-like ATPase
MSEALRISMDGPSAQGARPEARAAVDDLRARMGQAIIGQERVIERLLIALLADGNVLVEGVPGVAKTSSVKALAKNLDAEFSRIQFTLDLAADRRGRQRGLPPGGRRQRISLRSGPSPAT